MPTRREFLAGAFALLVTACTGGGKHKPTNSSSAAGGSITELAQGVPQVSLLGLGPGATGEDPANPIQVGTSILSFDLAIGTQGQLIEEGTPTLYVAKNETSPVTGPFDGAWSLFTGYEQTGDHSPKWAIPGVYSAQVTLPTPGLWSIAAVGPGGRAQGVGVTHVYVGNPKVATIGSKAVSVKTPV